MQNGSFPVNIAYVLRLILPLKITEQQRFPEGIFVHTYQTYATYANFETDLQFNLNFRNNEGESC